MRLEAARFDGESLILTTKDREAIRFAYGFLAGDYEIVKKKKKRSLDSNAYAWVLIDKLAEALSLPKEEVYRNTIRHIGGVSETVCVIEQGVEQLTKSWARNGLGWSYEVFDSRIEGCKNVTLHYGSSVYDQKQMGRLIDALVQDCKALNIETLPPDKLAAMLEEWK